MRINKMFFIFLTLLSVVLVLGCQADTSDDSNDIKEEISFISGEEIQDISIKYYISFKTHYMNELVKMGSEPYYAYDNPNNDLNVETTHLTNEIFYRIQNNSKAQEYIAYNQNQKVKDFYKILLAKKELEEHLPGIMETINEAVNYNISRLDENIPLSIDDDSSINISLIIDEVAKEFDLTYESAVDLICRPYMVYDGIIQFHMMYYLKNDYQDEKVKYNGQNEDEYKMSLIDYYKQYDMHLENLYKKS